MEDDKLVRQKVRIIDAALEEFNEKGLKFTMDDVAKRLCVSKKTIYKLFDNKESLFLEAVNHCYALIKAAESEILTDDSLDDLTKLRRVIIVLPGRFKTIDWRKISSLREAYPDIFFKITENIDSDWKPTIALIERLISDKIIRNISVPVLRLMIESSIKAFISDSQFMSSGVTYEAALEEMVDILIEGIEVR